jgi:hypothetical protein
VKKSAPTALSKIVMTENTGGFLSLTEIGYAIKEKQQTLSEFQKLRERLSQHCSC